VNHTKGDYSAKFLEAPEFVFALFLTNTKYRRFRPLRAILVRRIFQALV
jgi:hypothetical protein